MPTYEMPILIRTLNKPELMTILQRTAKTIFDTGGFIRKIENWGLKQLPCKMSAHGHPYTQANHFLLRFDVPPLKVEKIIDEYSRDIDIIRAKVYKETPILRQPCTFHEEMLPPPYRPYVQKLVKKANKINSKHQFKYNSGLNYYPFNK